MTVDEARGRAEAWLVDQMRDKGLEVRGMRDKRERLLAEIERRLANHEPPWDAQALRALRREIERHQRCPCEDHEAERAEHCMLDNCRTDGLCPECRLEARMYSHGKELCGCQCCGTCRATHLEGLLAAAIKQRDEQADQYERLLKEGHEVVAEALRQRDAAINCEGSSGRPRTPQY